MRTILLSAVLGLGIGLAGIPAASAAPVVGLSTPIEAGSLVEQAQYYYRRRGYHRRHNSCRNVRVCRVNSWGHRRCRTERVCRRW